MQEFEINIQISSDRNDKVEVQDTTTLHKLAKKYQQEFDNDIILGMVNGKLCELGKEIEGPCSISFVTVADRDGRRAYRRSTLLLLQKAVQSIYGNESKLHVLHSIGEGYYCELREDTGEEIKLSLEDLAKLKATMKAYSTMDIPIDKKSYRTEMAENYFQKRGMKDKAKLFHYRRSSSVNLYELDGVLDYFYGFMAPSTGYVKYFELELFRDGFVLIFPGEDPKKVEPLSTSVKLFETLDESRKWSRRLGVGTIGALNDAIAAGKGQELVLLQEALMEGRIGNLAEQIVSDRQKKFIMIAGPSSSGKTSFANRLSIQLTAKGLKPYPISLDDYYDDRDKCPRNPDGSFNYECLEALDVEQFNKDMVRLLNGEEVELPSFNFKTGKREYKGNRLTMDENTILVIEGIHGLNDKLSHMLPAESKFKIYISALTQINIDEHNPLPTTDGRLIRRIVRDARTRGTSARETIAMWPSVRKGEEENIFPFQDGADVMFNSALVYELPVLKVYAEPLLFNIPRDCPEYLEAKRLLKFLDYFLPFPAEDIAKNSLVREFTGGSCFNV